MQIPKYNCACDTRRTACTLVNPSIKLETEWHDDEGLSLDSVSGWNILYDSNYDRSNIWDRLAEFFGFHLSIPPYRAGWLAACLPRPWPCTWWYLSEPRQSHRHCLVLLLASRRTHAHKHYCGVVVRSPKSNHSRELLFCVVPPLLFAAFYCCAIK